jgi:DNA-directed RNA polymerase subunit H (RpoH/RPB5)
MTQNISNTIILSLYEKYQNIILCLGEKYRNWYLLDKVLSDSEFDKLMNQQKYIIHLTYNPEDELFVYIVLFHTTSIYLSKTESFRKFLDTLSSKIHKQDINKKQKFLEKIYDIDSKQKTKLINRIMTENKKKIEAIFITKRELTTYFIRNIQSKNEKIKLVVHNYLHKHFLIEISEGPLCAKHTRLTKNEAIDLLSRQLMTSAYTLPRILINDPHIIWCGAKVGEIVRIEVNSELAGKSIRYRIVTPLNGKLQSSDILIEDEEEDLEIDEEESENEESENEENIQEESIVSDDEEEEEEDFY